MFEVITFRVLKQKQPHLLKEHFNAWVLE